MNYSAKSLFILPLISLISFGIDAQPESDHKSPIEKISFLVGNWEGTGWNRNRQGTIENFTAYETVTWKLNKTALLFEGQGFSEDPETGEKVMGHNALGILTYNTRTDQFQFLPVLENGVSTDTYFKLVDENSIEWGFQLQNGGAIKYDITLNSNGQWVEKGNYSQDGTNWMQFMEMTLSKIDQ